MMRLQKYLAQCGVASRRNAEKMIADGLVMVNGKTVREMGTQVEDGDEVRVRGEVVTLEEEKHYLIYHKPAGEVTTVSDPEGRATVLDKFKDYPVRLYPVGRLDYDSEGLILLTNDGELCQAMLHPSKEVEKVYLAKVSNQPGPEILAQLRRGVMIDGHMTAPAKVRLVRQETFAAMVLVSIHEGRNRQVRKMFQAVGHQVLQLRRVQFGPLHLGGLERGRWRDLTADELAKLKELAQP